MEIIAEDLTKEEAALKEIEFIKLYGRKDIGTGILTNWTDGGEGRVGYKITDEVRSKMRAGCKNRPPRSKESNALQSKFSKEKSSRDIRCIETQKVYRGWIEVRDDMFPELKSAHKNIRDACNSNKPYKGYTFEYASEDNRKPLTRVIGSQVGTSKLTEDQVSELKTLYNSGVRACELAKMYNVTGPLIKNIKNEVIWKHIEPKIIHTPRPKKLYKLSAEDVAKIKNLKGTTSYAKLGKMFGVSSSIIYKIFNNRAWMEVT